jgi:cytochrome c biogenesis protein CcmG/thiol:disulfide interchange protein DsbE
VVAPAPGVQPAARPQAPDFTMASARDGKPVKLSDSAGKVRLVVFWTTFAAGAAQQAAMLEALRKAHPELEVVGVDGEPAATANAFLQAQNVGYASVVDDGSVYTAYNKIGGGVPSCPTLFVVDKQGQVANQHVGAVTQQQLEAEINALR